MMNMPAPSSAPKHHTRYYIVMITLVLGGIFLLLLMNDEQGQLAITGSTVGLFKNGTDAAVENSADIEEEQDRATTRTITQTFEKQLERSSREVDFSLAFDRIPRVIKEAKLDELQIEFSDVSSAISVNGDRLELSNLNEMTMNVLGFNGRVNFNENDISLDGTAKRLEVNGISLSSRDKIKLTVDGLSYEALNINNIELKDIEFDNGDGSLKVGEKLTYELEQDQMKLYYFNGLVAINKRNDTAVNLEGVARGISISGALLDFTVR